MAGLEGAAGACCFSTGMAATVTVMSAFLKAGELNRCAIASLFQRAASCRLRTLLRRLKIKE